MSDIQELIAQIHREAQRESFPIDEPIYQEAGLNPLMPILYGGNLESSLCFFARDLGKDEIQAQQPLYGAAGRLVRQGLYRAIYGKDSTNTEELQAILQHVILTNTVPYKPPGNKAYTQVVKKRFRPFLEQLLVFNWQGDRIITLGNEAFNWFEPYAPKGTLKTFFTRKDRYSATIEITISAQEEEGKIKERLITLMPLPHPSPLNQKYYRQFPAMLQERLATIKLSR